LPRSSLHASIRQLDLINTNPFFGSRPQADDRRRALILFFFEMALDANDSKQNQQEDDQQNGSEADPAGAVWAFGIESTAKHHENQDNEHYSQHDWFLSCAPPHSTPARHFAQRTKSSPDILRSSFVVGLP
jgi:hypothetical protein